MAILVTHLLLCGLMDQMNYTMVDTLLLSMNNAGLLSGNSISTTRVFIITNVTANDSGDYTCSLQGNSTTVTLRIAIIISKSVVNGIKVYSALALQPGLYLICARYKM